MWPKVLMQLMELLPHATRLLPMADRFFQSKAAGDEATLKAVESLRTDLTQTTSAHDGLYRQMNEQAERMSVVLAEVRATKTAVDAAEAKMERLEKKLAAQSFMMLASLAVSLVLLVLIVILLLRH